MQDWLSKLWCICNGIQHYDDHRPHSNMPCHTIHLKLYPRLTQRVLLRPISHLYPAFSAKHLEILIFTVSLSILSGSPSDQDLLHQNLVKVTNDFHVPSSTGQFSVLISLDLLSSIWHS